MLNLINKYLNEDGNIILYHVSNPLFREKIIEEGLTPQIGDSYQLHYEEITNEKLKPLIFFCFENIYCSSYNDDRYKVTLTLEEFNNLNFKIDEEVYNSVCTENKIDLDKISIIYEGVEYQDYDWVLDLDKDKLIDVPLLDYKNKTLEF